ncbi:MAG: hypothetical protein KKH41_07205 [Candidatus Thermoplasmatota archaeon]|nr:hypothetical protein [Euryarchaeota archaeon]MBU4031369.1 hypothetical protein [Candidatus Thermoplasmatota archaeon]MBU4071339.1 hypothetical protein [Candidatus Thermoplasmatota archaeon]MBU4143341.1 hypothetical protein [Candidatus Thermoplasmatota archaeon]MBU4592354.1 hypothetical protein [Candidatus Thermoplasmatota archaeon]
MVTCELCGAENTKGLETCSRCGFVFRKEVRADIRDSAILKRHKGKTLENVNRDLKNAQAKFTAYLDNMAARRLSREELSSLLDDALAYLLIPLTMGVEDELKFNQQEKQFINQVVENLEIADMENGVPVGTPGTYIRLSNALQALDEPEIAMTMIDRALLLNPRNRDAMLSRAKLLFYTKRYAQARKYLEKILKSGDDEKARYLIELIDQISPD